MKARITLVSLAALALIAVSSRAADWGNQQQATAPTVPQVPAPMPQVPAPMPQVAPPTVPAPALGNGNAMKPGSYYANGAIPNGNCAGNCANGNCAARPGFLQQLKGWFCYYPTAGDALPILHVHPYVGPYSGTFPCISPTASPCAANCGRTKQTCTCGGPTPPPPVSQVLPSPVSLSVDPMRWPQGYPGRGCQGGSEPSPPTAVVATPVPATVPEMPAMVPETPAPVPEVPASVPVLPEVPATPVGAKPATPALSPIEEIAKTLPAMPSSVPAAEEVQFHAARPRPRLAADPTVVTASLQVASTPAARTVVAFIGAIPVERQVVATVELVRRGER